MDGVIGRFGVSEMNENKEKLIKLCAEKKMSVKESFFRRIFINLRG